ncbi:HPr family phosphocarrier protein [Fusobacterium sp. PH5-44]|uniref:HPr family phosphocarrier protein n=1 Tax=unclassified Fusobacterium TaxID=2648384 RepID=UPI003D1FE479
MVSKIVEIVNENGLHTRQGNEFVALAQSFSSEIQLEDETGRKVSGISLLKILSLGIRKGMKVVVHADGEDEKEAIIKLEELLKGMKDI